MKKLIILALNLLFFIPLISFAQDYAKPQMLNRPLEEGFDYQNIIPNVPTKNKDSNRVEVVEMFWYGCPHCYHFEPIIKQWLSTLPANVDFIRIPAIFSSDWEAMARAFYTAEALGVLNKVHSPLFKLAQDKGRNINQNDIRALFQENGIANYEFDRTFNSFNLEIQINRSKDLSKRYGIDGVPAMIVNGKYRTSGTLTGGLDKLPPIINALIQKELSKNSEN